MTLYQWIPAEHQYRVIERDHSNVEPYGPAILDTGDAPWFYTTHEGFNRFNLSYQRWGGTGWFENWEEPAIQTDCLYRLRANRWNNQSELAYELRMPSVAAMFWAARQAEGGVLIGSWADGLHECSLSCCYTEPKEPESCGQCGERDCEECWPDGYHCDCCDRECSDCYPDGYECGCGDGDCSDCFPPEDVFDDQGDDDGISAMPDMPATAPDRCRFGIEVEFNGGGRYDIINLVQRAGIACMDSGYTHEVTRFWKMTTDATVTGGELVSPIMSGSDESIEQVREVIRQVKAGGGRTARNVGMHVHLDVSQFDRDQLRTAAWNLWKMERALAGFVPEHRYDGSVSCTADLMDSGSWNEILEWLETVNVDSRRRSIQNRESSAPIGRYASMNFNSLLTYGSIECRLLGHTLNTLKVQTWIRVLQTIIVASGNCIEIEDGDDLIMWLIDHGCEPVHVDRFREVVQSRGHDRYLIAA